MKSIARALQLVALAALVAGCAHAAADPYRSARRPIRIDVVNLNFNDASLWAVYPGDRVRLGTVTGKKEASFQLPWKGTEAVYMEIDLVGGQRCTTDALQVDEGDVLYLEIALDFSQMGGCRNG